MSGEVDAGLQQMRAFAEAGQGRGENGMAVAAEAIGDPPPAPAAVPCAVHQHKSVSHSSPLPALAFFTGHDPFEKRFPSSNHEDKIFRIMPFQSSMIFSENRFPLFRIMP